MRLLLFSRDFAPSVGGVQTIVAELATGLAEWREPSAGLGTIEVTVVTNTGGCSEGEDPLFVVVRKPSLFKSVQLIRRADLIHLAGPAIIPLFLGLLFGKRCIVEHHGFQTVCPNGQLFYEPNESACPGYFMAGRYGKCVACNRKTVGLLGSIRMLLMTPVRRWLCNRAQSNIMPTQWLAPQLKLKRNRVIWHGVQISRKASEDAEGDKSKTTFGYQGRLVSTKGVRVLLRAFEQLCSEGRNLRLIVVGAGPEEQSLKTASARFGGQVEFLGPVQSEKLNEILAEAAAVVMPSLAGEVFGLVAVENMVRGKALIVSDLGALREVVGDAALVFPAGNAIALADCMRRVMDDAQLAGFLAGAACERAARVFDRRRMIQEHILVYREALTSGEP